MKQIRWPRDEEKKLAHAGKIVFHDPDPERRSEAARVVGAVGGKARFAGVSEAEKRDIAKNAAAARKNVGRMGGRAAACVCGECHNCKVRLWKRDQRERDYLAIGWTDQEVRAWREKQEWRDEQRRAQLEAEKRPKRVSAA